MDLFPNGIVHYAAGGLLIGLAVSLAFVLAGLITGMSSVFTTTWSYASGLSYFSQSMFHATRDWRLMLALGLVIGAAISLQLTGAEAFVTELPWWRLALGGLVAGFGARLSNGCTSGHGICGMASLQLPSILSVVVFLTTAAVVANLWP